ncbi:MULTISPECIES: hypothetical protein [Pseudonocardia]|nr:MULTISPECIES: hypothetical protein [Pseudonocardia]
MALNADDLKQRIDDATNNIAGDIRGLKAKLDEALAGSDAHAAQAVQDALAGFDTLAARLEHLADETPEDELEHPADPDHEAGETHEDDAQH